MTQSDQNIDWIARIDAALTGTGLFVRGAFHPTNADGAPDLSNGSRCGTVALIGNAGNTLWEAFQAERPDMNAPHPLDTWVGRHLRRAADGSGGELLNPMRPPYPPVQQWAVRAGAGFRSPINLLVHPDFGLWHTFRGVLLFAETLELPPVANHQSPCVSCTDKPCLTRCPVTAFEPSGSPEPATFHPAVCVDHVEGSQGRACQTGGCLARRACPVGRTWAYKADPAAYHMSVVVRTIRRWQSGEDGDKPATLTV